MGGVTLLKRSYFAVFAAGAVVVLLMLRCSATMWLGALGNLNVLKTLAPYGVDPQLQYPLGHCVESAIVGSSPSLTVPVNASDYLSGLVALRSGDLPRAEGHLSESVRRTDARVVGGYAMGILQHLQGKEPSAFWRDGSGAIFLTMGKECMRIGNRALATTYYHTALQTLDTRDTNGYRDLLLFFATTADNASYERALERYQNLAAGDSIEHNWTLARAFIAHGDAGMALPHLERILVRTPDDPQAWYFKAQAQSKLHEYDEARESLREAIRNAASTPDFYVFLGHTYLYQGQVDQATEWYSQALRLDPDYSWALASLAHARLQQGRYEEANILAQNALSVDPNAATHALVSDVAVQLGDLARALEHAVQASQLDPSNADYSRRVARACIAQGELECAREAYESILAVNPQDADAKMGLESILEVR